jgi:hypothetical protein
MRTSDKSPETIVKGVVHFENHAFFAFRTLQNAMAKKSAGFLGAEGMKLTGRIR